MCKLAKAKYYLSIAKSGNNVTNDVFHSLLFVCLRAEIT